MSRAARWITFLATTIGCASPPRAPAASTPKPAPAKPVVEAKYPARFLPIPPAEVEAREKAFRARNPEPWIKVKFDAFGLLAYAQIIGPTPTAMPTAPEYDDAAMAAKWAAFLEHNRDVLAMDAPGMQPVGPKAHRTVGYWQFWGNHVVGAAHVAWYGVGYTNGVFSPPGVSVGGHGWAIAIPPPKERTDDELAAPYVGLRGTLTTVYKVRQMPCDPPGKKFPNPCGKQPSPEAPPPKLEPYAIARDELLIARSICRYLKAGDPAMELRVAARIDIRVRVIHPSGGFGISGSSGFAPEAKDPIPKLTDVVTGEDLSAGRCDDGR